MPDWTYLPLRRPMSALFGHRRSLRMALAVVSWLVRVPGGAAVVAGLGHTHPPPSAHRLVAGTDCAAPVGASVGPALAAQAMGALPPLGAGLLEVGPVSLSQVAAIRAALRRRRAPVALRLAAEDAGAVAAALAPEVDLFVLDVEIAGAEALAQLQRSVAPAVLAGMRLEHAALVPPNVGIMLREARPADVPRLVDRHPVLLVTTSDPSIAGAAALVSAGAQVVLATQAALIASGPGWFQRVTGAILDRGRSARPVARVASGGWLAGLALGLGMAAGGIGAAVVALGPVLLPYDVAFLGRDVAGLHRLNPQLVHFLQHDRITLSGTMVALGALYAGLSGWGLRADLTWARDTMLASGLVGFPTLFYFLAFHYVEPVHVALALGLFPLFVLAVWQRPPRRPHPLDGDEWPLERQRALVGQLLMVLVGAGLIIGGATISYVGLTSVFVPSDLALMATSAHVLVVADDRLPGFVAHDRAGFGGALISTGVVVLLIAAWGWHRGESWVWWCLAIAATGGFGAAIAIHLWIGYTDLFHLAPVYAGSLLSGVALGLSRRYLTRPGQRAHSPARPDLTAGLPAS